MLGLVNSLTTSTVLDQFTNAKSLVLDGSDYVDTGHTFQATHRGSFTWSIWVKLDDGQPNSQIDYLIGSTNGSDEDRFGLNVRSTSNAGKIRIDYTADGDDCTYTTDNAIFPDGATNWTHICAVVTKTTNTAFVIYIDGVAVPGTLANATAEAKHAAWTSDKNMYLGCLNNNGTASNFWTGNMDEVAVWNVALSDLAVRAVHNGGKPFDLNYNRGQYGNSSALQAYWRMFDKVAFDSDEDRAGTAGNVIYDASNPGLGPNIWDSTPSTSHLSATSSNTSSIEDGAYKVTYVNSLNGFSLKINDSVTSTTSEDLVVGDIYKVVTEWRCVGGNGFTCRIFKAGVSSNLSPIEGGAIAADEDFVTKNFYLKCSHATDDRISIQSNLGAGETAYLKVISVQKLNGYPAETSASTKSSTSVP